MICQTNSPLLVLAAPPTPEAVTPMQPLEGSSFTELLTHPHQLLNGPVQCSEDFSPPTLSVLHSTLAMLETVDSTSRSHLVLSAGSLPTLLPADSSLEEPDASQPQEEQEVLEHLLALLQDIAERLPFAVTTTTHPDTASPNPFTAPVDALPAAGGGPLLVGQMSDGQGVQTLPTSVSVTTLQRPGAENHVVTRADASVASEQTTVPLAGQSAALGAAQHGIPPLAGLVEGQPAGHAIPVFSEASTAVLQSEFDRTPVAENMVGLTDAVFEADTQFAYPPRPFHTAATVEAVSTRTRRLNDMTSAAARTTDAATSLATLQVSHDNTASQSLVDATDITPATETRAQTLDAPEPAARRGFTRLPPETTARLLGHPLPRNTIMLQLEPPELGFVQVQVRVHHESLTATFWADSSDVRTLLHTYLPVLHQALQEQGFDASEISINLTSGSFAGHSGQFAQQHTPFSAPVPMVEERLTATSDAVQSSDAQHLRKYTGQPVRLVDLVI